VDVGEILAWGRLPEAEATEDVPLQQNLPAVLPTEPFVPATLLLVPLAAAEVPREEHQMPELLPMAAKQRHWQREQTGVEKANAQRHCHSLVQVLQVEPQRVLVRRV